VCTPYVTQYLHCRFENVTYRCVRGEMAGLGGDHFDDGIQQQCVVSQKKNILTDRRTRTMVRFFFGIAKFLTLPSLER